MKHAFVFPGQGAQFTGMGKAFYEQSPKARDLFEQANDLLGFRISDVMFEGSEADLKQTKVTQPAVFLHSVIGFLCLENARPDMTAGHSLGEFSALVANGALSFADALRLVSIRANAMQKACEITPSTMAVVLGLDDAKVEEACATITDDTVVPANYNCPGQLVISGTKTGIARAMDLLKAAGAKRVMELAVGGAFHSPLMAPAQQELQAAIESIAFNTPHCPVYQNVVAKAVTDPSAIKQNLITQLTGAVKWTQCVQAMVADGAARFTEVGPGKVLQGLIAKIDKNVATDGVSDTLVLA